MLGPPKPKSKLEIEMDKLVLKLNDYPTDSKEYGEIVERLKTLHKIQDDNKPASVSPDVKLTTAANLLGILMIIRHEQLHVITSKAMSFVTRIR
jgi:hypothetical protein